MFHYIAFFILFAPFFPSVKSTLKFIPWSTSFWAPYRRRRHQWVACWNNNSIAGFKCICSRFLESMDIRLSVKNNAIRFSDILHRETKPGCWYPYWSFAACIFFSNTISPHRLPLRNISLASFKRSRIGIHQITSKCTLWLTKLWFCAKIEYRNIGQTGKLNYTLLILRKNWVANYLGRSPVIPNLCSVCVHILMP